MSKDIGTLQEIGAKVGDVVEWVSWSDGSKSCRDLYKGVKWNIIQSHPRGWCDGLCAYYEKDSIGDLGHGYETMTSKTIFRIISRANQGPVREVTRMEIVPGVYGKVKVHDPGSKYVRINVDSAMDVDALTAAIDTLTQIRDAMENNP